MGRYISNSFGITKEAFILIKASSSVNAYLITSHGEEELKLEQDKFNKISQLSGYKNEYKYYAVSPYEGDCKICIYHGGVAVLSQEQKPFELLEVSITPRIDIEQRKNIFNIFPPKGELTFTYEKLT